MNNLKLFTGEGKAIPLNALPESAWTIISGDEKNHEGDPNALRRVVGFLNRCINIRADSVSAVPWAVTKIGSDDDLWTQDDPVPPELAWAKDLKRLINLIEAALCMRSEAFLYIERGAGKTPRKLKWLSPLTMKPIWEKEAGLVAFERKLGASDVRRLRLEDVAYIWSPDPMHETKPDVPVAVAACVSAGVLNSIDQYVTSFFNRGAIKATLLTVEGNPSREEKERLKAWWARFFSGVTKSWGTEVVNAGVKPVAVGEGLEGLTNTELTDEKRKEIAVSFGIPFSMLFSDAANYATAKQDKMNFYDETIIPELDIIGPVLNDTVFAPLGLEFHFRANSMDVYQEDERERAEALARYVAAGIPLAVAAEMLGLDLPPGVEYADLIPATPPPTLTASGNPTAGISGGPGGIAAATEKSPSESAKRADLERWERKALRLFSEGKSPDVDFESQHISEQEKVAIRKALAQAKDKRGVSKAFLSGEAVSRTGSRGWI